MPQFRPDRVRPEYKPYVDAIRHQHGDERIIDVIERYHAGGYHRDEAMDVLGIDYIGTWYELWMSYDVDRPEPDLEEEERQLEVMRLLLDGKEVPQELRQPAWWKPTIN